MSLSGAKAQKPQSKPQAKRTNKSPVNTGKQKASQRQANAIDAVSNAVMLLDRDFKITYANAASKALLIKHRNHLPTVARDIDPNNMTGASMDIFHMDPSHQRRVLADPSRLPYHADVRMGPLTFALSVAASYDGKGALDGYVFEWDDVTENRQLKAQIEAINKVLIVVEFSPDGKFIAANDIYLKLFGCSFDEIRGRHHSLFVDPAHRETQEYRMFWEKLAQGEYQTAQSKRVVNGREFWVQGNYIPMFDTQGKVYKILACASDCTAQKKLEEANIKAKGEIDAIHKAQAAVEFKLDGSIVTANGNFLQVTGYTLNEIKGQHQSMFVDPAYRQSPEYRMFWEKLGRGEFDAGQYRRIGKGGREVWIQASYNPIFDANGKPYKVVKYATDITAHKQAELRLQAAMELAVRQTQEIVEAAQDNDLTQRIPIDGKAGEIEKLCAGVNGLLDTMAGVVSSMLEVSSTVSSAVAEIASGTNDLSQRTEQQASSLEETAASMEEMASSVRQNADNAQQANQLAISARSAAAAGGGIAGKAVEAMERIEQSSGKISEIISVIDEIAFQTNLLALNAAVEAARAGDAGKGFAVVASEVRSLAQRTSVAAKDIKSLIMESGRQVKEGVKLVGNAGSSLGEIVTSINRVADIVAEIAAASKQQAQGVEEINKAVAQMDQMTQQNGALVEESAASSRTLQEEAQSMYEKMSAYAIGDAPAPGEIRTPSKRAAAPSQLKRPEAAPAARKSNGARAFNGMNGKASKAAAHHASGQTDSDWKEF